MSAKKKSINDRLKIVIAEDSPTQAEQLKYILETNGYQVAAVSNGKEALALVRSDRPNIVISDIVMPEMDGYELCKQIKMDEELKDVPVILLTALSDPADVIKGLECGADNFVTKPYDERVLLSRIEYLRLNWRLQETKQVRMGVEITFSGRKYFITSDRLQILNLLLSTYESAVGKNRELEQAQAELRRLNEQLEQRVKERSADLLKTNEKLELEIAERKMAQERIIHLNSVLRAVRGVNQLITHGPDRERLIEQSCDLMVKTRGFLCIWILLFDEKKKYISAAVTGVKETRAFYQQLKRGDYPPCIDKILAQKDSLAICGDIVENGLDCLPRSLYSGGSGLIGRLEYRGKVYGIISTYIQSDYSHDPEEQSLFRELAGDIAFALNDIEREEERKKAEEEIARFKVVSDLATYGITMLDTDLRITYANKICVELHGYTREELIGKHCTILIPENQIEVVERLFEKSEKTGGFTNEEVMHKRKDGTTFPALMTGVTVRDDSGKPVYTSVVFLDVTGIKQAEEVLRASLHEKEVLLKEVYHRVKNNLQIIISLLNTQSRYIKDKRDLELFQESQDRIRAMAMVHERLYQAGDLGKIDFGEYVKSQANELFMFYGIDRARVQMKIDIRDVYLGITEAVPLGLLVNELITNSLKHAFPRDRAGDINISLRQDEEGRRILTVSDNGVGLPEAVNWQNPKTMGLQLMQGLAKQLDADVVVDRRGQGTRFIITLPGAKEA